MTTLAVSTALTGSVRPRPLPSPWAWGRGAGSPEEAGLGPADRPEAFSRAGSGLGQDRGTDPRTRLEAGHGPGSAATRCGPRTGPASAGNGSRPPRLGSNRWPQQHSVPNAVSRVPGRSGRGSARSSARTRGRNPSQGSSTTRVSSPMGAMRLSSPPSPGSMVSTGSAPAGRRASSTVPAQCGPTSGSAPWNGPSAA